MSLTTHNLVLPPAPYEVPTAVVTISIIIGAILYMASAFIVIQVYHFAFRGFVLGLATMTLSLGAILTPLAVNQVMDNEYSTKATHAAKIWVTDHYQQHFDQKQLDQLTHGLTWFPRDENRNSTETYGSTRILQNGSVVTVTFLRVGEQYKVVEASYRELPVK